jgi:hypothetical protein
LLAVEPEYTVDAAGCRNTAWNLSHVPAGEAVAVGRNQVGLAAVVARVFYQVA